VEDVKEEVVKEEVPPVVEDPPSDDSVIESSPQSPPAPKEPPKKEEPVVIQSPISAEESYESESEESLPTPVAEKVEINEPRPAPLTRAARAKLAKRGFKDLITANLEPSQAPDIDAELNDDKNINDLSLAFSYLELKDRVDCQSIILDFYFYSFNREYTNRIKLLRIGPNEYDPSLSDYEINSSNEDESDVPPYMTFKYRVDTYACNGDEGRRFASYCIERVIYIRIIDGHTMIPIGTGTYNIYVYIYNITVLFYPHIL
jgi:hypothetical protein